MGPSSILGTSMMVELSSTAEVMKLIRPPATRPPTIRGRVTYQNVPGSRQGSTQAREIPAVEDAEVSHRQHHPGNRQRHGGDRIQQVPPEDPTAQEQPRNDSAQNHVHSRSEEHTSELQS